MKKSFILLLSVIVFLSSCTMYMHPGVTMVTKPSITETDQSKWVAYYEDQFDAYKMTVFPPDSNYPDAARQAYQQVSVEWQKKSAKHTVGVCVGIALTLTVGTILIGEVAGSGY